MSKPLWIVHCVDAADAAQRRAAARPAHSARLRTATTRPVLYGPLVAADGTTPVGSLLVLAADTRAEVERFVEEDPFTTQKVWETVDVHRFTQSTNSPNPLV